MADLIDRQKIKARFEPWLKVKGYSEGELNMLKAVLYEITVMPSADAVEVVRCKDCKHRWVNEHYGEKGYMKIKAMCSLDTDDPFELGRSAYDDDWFCADGERKDE